jgi:hypothetical protein
MNTNSIAVATITWARTPAEDKRLRRSLERLADTGMPIAIADAGTDPDFPEFLTRHPGFHVTVPRRRGLIEQVTASIGVAAGFDTPFILYTEPDKELFFGPAMRDFVQRAMEQGDKGGLGVALAARSDESFTTYPPMQRYTEGVINQLCGDCISLRGDYSYGPFLLSRVLVPHLGTLRRELGWGWRHFAFLTAHRLGLRLIHVTGDYTCPPDQREEDEAERRHRLRQLSENILGLIAQP